MKTEGDKGNIYPFCLMCSPYKANFISETVRTKIRFPYNHGVVLDAFFDHQYVDREARNVGRESRK